jgi:hypothetical protein
MSNAPAVFQRAMQEVLGHHIGAYLQVYVDDILMYSCNRDEHMVHLATALKC